MSKLNRGITLIEIIVIVFILGLISSIVFFNLSAFRDSYALKSNSADIVSLINKARSNTLSSLSSKNYGIHFDTDKVSLFDGITFNPVNPTNETLELSSALDISSVVIEGGSNDIIFQRLTGAVTNGTSGTVGTITVTLKSNPLKSKIITISKTGNISLN